MRRLLRRGLPSAITLLGFALSLFWLSGGHPFFGFAGLCLDTVDGRVARRLRAETKLGAELDFMGDVALACLVLWTVGTSSNFWKGASICLLLLFAAFMKSKKRRVSGRTSVTLLALVYQAAIG